jgi:hypothetical protein
MIIVGLIVQHMDVLPMAESHRESRKIKGLHAAPPDFSGR